MAQLPKPFNPMEHNPAQMAGKLPVGNRMLVQIKNSEVKANNGGTGGLMALTLQVMEGPNMGQSGMMNVNMWSANAVTAEIAHRNFSAICWAVGYGQTVVGDTVQLHGRNFEIDVALQQPVTEKMYTEVTHIYCDGGAEPGPAQQNHQPQPRPNQVAAQPAAAAQPSAAAAPAFAQNGIAANVQMPAETQQQQPATAWAGGQTAQPQQQAVQQQAAPAAGAPSWSQGAATGGTANAAPSWGQPKQ